MDLVLLDAREILALHGERGLTAQELWEALLGPAMASGGASDHSAGGDGGTCRPMTAAALGIVPGVFLGAITRQVLSAVGAHRDKGVLQAALADEMQIDHKTVFYHLKSLESLGLICRRAAVVPDKPKAGKEGGNGGIVSTNVVFLQRCAPKLCGRLLDADTIAAGRGASSDCAVAAGGAAAVELDENRAAVQICERLAQEREKTLWDRELKEMLRLEGKSGHRQWRRLKSRLVEIGVLQESIAKHPRVRKGTIKDTLEDDDNYALACVTLLRPFQSHVHPPLRGWMETSSPLKPLEEKCALVPPKTEDDFPAARLAATWKVDAAEHLSAAAHRFLLACGGGGARKSDIAAALQVPVKRMEAISAELQASGLVMASRETQGRSSVTKFFAVAVFGTGNKNSSADRSIEFCSRNGLGDELNQLKFSRGKPTTTSPPTTDPVREKRRATQERLGARKTDSSASPTVAKDVPPDVSGASLDAQELEKQIYTNTRASRRKRRHLQEDSEMIATAPTAQPPKRHQHLEAKESGQKKARKSPSTDKTDNPHPATPNPHCQQSVPAGESLEGQPARTVVDSAASSGSTNLPFQDWLAAQILAKSTGLGSSSESQMRSGTIDFKEWCVCRTIHEVREKSILVRVDAAKMFKRDADIASGKMDRRTVSRIFSENRLRSILYTERIHGPRRMNSVPSDHILRLEGELLALMLKQVVARGAATAVTLWLPGLSSDQSEALLAAGLKMSDKAAQDALAAIHAAPRHGITFAISAQRLRSSPTAAAAAQVPQPAALRAAPRPVPAAPAPLLRNTKSFLRRPRHYAATYANGFIRPMIRRLRDFHIFLVQLAEEKQAPPTAPLPALRDIFFQLTVDQYCRWIGVGHVLLNESHHEHIFLAAATGGSAQLCSLGRRQLELLGVQYRVDVLTIRKYIRQLEKLGLLEQVPGKEGVETCLASRVAIPSGNRRGSVDYPVKTVKDCVELWRTIRDLCKSSHHTNEVHLIGKITKICGRGVANAEIWEATRAMALPPSLRAQLVGICRRRGIHTSQESFVEIKEAASAADVPEAAAVRFLEELVLSFDSQGARTSAADAAWLAAACAKIPRVTANFRGGSRTDQLSAVQRAAAEEVASEISARRQRNQRYKHVWKSSEDAAIISAYVAWAAAHPNKGKPRSWVELSRALPPHIPLVYVRSRWRKIRSSESRRRKLAAAIWASARAALQQFCGNCDDGAREAALSRQYVQEIVDELHNDEDAENDEEIANASPIRGSPKAKNSKANASRLRVRVIRRRLVDGFPRRRRQVEATPAADLYDKVPLAGVSGRASYDLESQWKVPKSLPAPAAVGAFQHGWGELGLVNSGGTSKLGRSGKEGKEPGGTQPLKYKLLLRTLAWEWRRRHYASPDPASDSCAMPRLTMAELEMALQDFVKEQNVTSLSELEAVSRSDSDLLLKETQLQAYVVAVGCAVLSSLLPLDTGGEDIARARSSSSSSSWLAAQGTGIVGVTLGLLRSRGVLASAGKLAAKVSALLGKETRTINALWAKNENDDGVPGSSGGLKAQPIMSALLGDGSGGGLRHSDVADISTLTNSTDLRKNVMESLAFRIGDFRLPSITPGHALSSRALLQALASYSRIGGGASSLPPHRIQAWSSRQSEVESQLPFLAPRRLSGLDCALMATARLKMAQGSLVLLHGASSSVVLSLQDEATAAVIIPIGSSGGAESDTASSIAPRIWMRRPCHRDATVEESPEDLIVERFALPLLDFTLAQVRSHAAATSSQVCRALNEACGGAVVLSIGEVEELLYALEDCQVLRFYPCSPENAGLLPRIFQTGDFTSESSQGEGHWQYAM